SGEDTMFGWRKKQEGFEWHQYVRTTIKVRREARRDKVDRMKRSAADGMKAAGKAAEEGVKAAGEAAGSFAREGAHQAAHGARVAAGAAGSMAKNSAQMFGAGARVAASAAAAQTWAGILGFGRACAYAASAMGWGVTRALHADSLQPALHLLGRPGVSSPLAIVGAIGLLAGITRPAMGFGLDRDAGFGLLLGLICLLLAYVPRAVLGTAPAMPALLARIDPQWRRMGAYASVALVAGAIVWSFLPQRGALPGLGQLSSLTLGSTQTIEGRATVLAGDLIRVDHTLVKLAGIEAPEREQRCLRPGNRRWRCAEAATDALARLTRRRAIVCQTKGTDELGRMKAVCYDGTTDIGAALVNAGHVFAEPGFMSSYAKQEAAAKSAKLGLWSGESERPSDFRARTWEEAKRSAPEGCPIKGQLAGNAKLYVLPWSADYHRVRVSKARGERWFCSEQEAISAGWKAIERS
ncbi:MAG: thermonuclease family protein, partial [Hyphomicrobiaceae bacterium]